MMSLKSSRFLTASLNQLFKARHVRPFSRLSSILLWDLKEYREHINARAADKLVPLPLSAEQVKDLVGLLQTKASAEDEKLMLELISNRVNAGVDPAAQVKAAFLTDIVTGKAKSPSVSKSVAVKLLGQMLGGYNVVTLVKLLDDSELAPLAAEELKSTLLVFDQFHDILEKSKKGNKHAEAVIKSWAEAEWFTRRASVPKKITVAAFKVPGETNTDDLSPAPDAWSRPDIPLHAKSMYKIPRDGVTNASQQIADLKKTGFPVALLGDVMGTGSSRKSATNSVLWYIGDPIPGIPNKNSGGVCFGGKVAPIFFNTMEDAGALVFEADVTKINSGDVIDIYPYEGKIKNNKTGAELCSFTFKSDVILDEVQAGGRINQ